MPTPPPPPPWFCPRDCHRGRTYPTFEDVKKHVEGQHPDYDPRWFDTYPDAPGTTTTA